MTRPELTPEAFHDGEAPVYDAPVCLSSEATPEATPEAKTAQTPEYSRQFRHAEHMAVVSYPGSHGGNGTLKGRWLYCEEPGKSEGLLQSGIQLMMDSTLAPGASIGQHRHTDTEEIYYLLSGSVDISLQTETGETLTATLIAGDSHLIQPGQSHQVQAGEDGARIIVVAAQVPGDRS